MTKIQVRNSRTRKWISQTISILVRNERNLQGEYSYSSSTDTKRIRRVKHLAQGHTISDVAGSDFKTTFVCSLKAVYTVPKQNESVSEILFGRKVITRDRNKTGGPGMYFMCE